MLMVLASAACEPQAPSAPPAAGPIPVTVVTLEQQPVTLSRELPGRTSPYLVAEIRPQVSGIIERRLFEEGAQVEVGQPLYQLDNAVYEANLASARAALARARATLESAQVTADRLRKLVKSNAVSRQEYDEAAAALRVAEAEVQAARAEVQNREIELGYAQITSPIAGRIGRSTVTQGALVTANQADALTTVRQLDPIYVDVTMSASELLDLRRQIEAGRATRVEQVPVTVILDDGTPYAKQGKLTFADLTVEPTTGSFLLRAVVPNPDVLLLPGMYVRARIALAERRNAVLVPQQGITRDPKGNATALVVTADGKVEPRQVEVSRAIGDKWLVESGLAAGDRVIVEGLQKVRPGAEVQPTEAADQAAATPQTAGEQAAPAQGGNQPAASGG